MEDNKMFHCPVEATLSVIGGKYKCIILYHLAGQVLRFSQLQRLIPNVTAKMLAQQLHDLENFGLIHKTIYPVVPPKTEYCLTDFGKTLSPIVTAMCDWGKQYMGERILSENESGREVQK
ncbi:winged helix-turn-helix transcriptional regulator [uncultured Dialister sp.]